MSGDDRQGPSVDDTCEFATGSEAEQPNHGTVPYVPGASSEDAAAQGCAKQGSAEQGSAEQGSAEQGSAEQGSAEQGAAARASGDETLDTGPPHASRPMQQHSAGGATRLTVFGDYEIIEESRVAAWALSSRPGTQFEPRRRVENDQVGRMAGADEVRRFHVEAEAAASLDHPAIVPIYELARLTNSISFRWATSMGELAQRIAEGPLPRGKPSSWC